MSDEKKPELSAKKAAFIEAFREKKIPLDACTVVGISRKTFETWRREDPDFAEEFRCAHMDVYDELQREALKDVGLLEGGGKKWRNHTLLLGLLRTNPYAHEEQKAPASAQPLQINGLDMKLLAVIVSPEAAGQAVSQALKSVGLNGAAPELAAETPKAKKPVPPIIQRLRERTGDKRAAKSEVTAPPLPDIPAEEFVGTIQDGEYT